jgi:DNA-binding MarR family transcriptional regulator
MEYRKCINFLLTIAQHDVFMEFSENLSQFGITPGQYGVLACLWENDSLTPKEIAAILRVENSTISGVLDRMEKRDLINRVLDPHNKRSIRVQVTEKGLAIKEPVQKKIEELNQSVLHDFSPDERIHLLNYLARIGHIQHSDS